LATTKQFLDDLGLSSLEQLPPLQQVGTEVLPEEAAAAVHAMEQNLQASLDQAAIDFSEPSVDEPSQSVTLARGDHQDEGQDVPQEEAQEEAQEGSEVSLPDEHNDMAPTESPSDIQDDSTRPQ
jgi:segregation and condensation protein B